MPRPIKSSKPVGYWLLSLAFAVFVMAIIGAITRLTGSGLSMVDWHPILQMIPPLTDGDWQDAFTLYQVSPQYLDINHGMTLLEFKHIYFWEWFHRLWGMTMGAVMLGGMLYFAARGYFTRALLPSRPGKWIAIFAALFLLGLAQGRIGWFMVQSGLDARPSVSPYRLAMHLTTALTLYAALIWSGLSLLHPTYRAAIDARPLRRHALIALGLVVMTMIWGCFVAGLHAGLVYNTFPLMGGHITPPDLLFLHPLILNFFENPSAVQFTHRVLAILTFCVALALSLRVRKAGAPSIAHTLAGLLALAVLCQVGLGISTLLLMVPVALGAAHQAGAITVLTLLLGLLFALRAPAKSSPEPAA
jgi:cytochrome c oxidase assembly protein subunit 15